MEGCFLNNLDDKTGWKLFLQNVFSYSVEAN